jgi:membrane associated rhomboid family serine protease
MGGLIPLGDASRRPRSSAGVVLTLILVNAWVFLQELEDGRRFVRLWSAIPFYITHGHRIATVVTSMFLHASWMHIIGNMVFLWAFGPSMEDAMGHRRFLFFYLSGGIVAMLAQVLANPNSRVPCLGASGAIAAVMGAFIVTYPRDRIRTLLFLFIFVRITFVPAALLIGFWFLTQLFDFGLVAEANTGGVAYLAHIAGFLYGVVLGRLFMDERRIALHQSLG